MRKEERYILPADEACPTLWERDGKMQNFRRAIGSRTRNDDEATRRVYRLIRENGDVIRGVFCGHWTMPAMRKSTPGGTVSPSMCRKGIHTILRPVMYCGF